MDGAMDMLMARQTAAERMIEALALALDRAGVLPLENLLSVADLMRINARATEGDEAAHCMGFVIDRLRAHQASGNPLSTLAQETALLARVDPALRAAMQSWLAIATIPEIADELAQLTRRSGESPLLPRRKPPGAPDGRGSGGAAG